MPVSSSSLWSWRKENPTQSPIPPTGRPLAQIIPNPDLVFDPMYSMYMASVNELTNFCDRHHLTQFDSFARRLSGLMRLCDLKGFRSLIVGGDESALEGPESIIRTVKCFEGLLLIRKLTFAVNRMAFTGRKPHQSRQLLDLLTFCKAEDASLQGTASMNLDNDIIEATRTLRKLRQLLSLVNDNVAAELIWETRKSDFKHLAPKKQCRILTVALRDWIREIGNLYQWPFRLTNGLSLTLRSGGQLYPTLTQSFNSSEGEHEDESLEESVADELSWTRYSRVGTGLSGDTRVDDEWEAPTNHAGVDTGLPGDTQVDD